MFDGLIIFEMANNHQGSVDHALKIISSYSKISKKYKLNGAIKLQYRTLPSFISKKQLKLITNKHIDRFLSTNLKEIEFEKIC